MFLRDVASFWDEEVGVCDCGISGIRDGEGVG